MQGMRARQGILGMYSIIMVFLGSVVFMPHLCVHYVWGYFRVLFTKYLRALLKA